MTDHTKALADALERTERQLRHLIEEVTHRPNPTNPDEVRIRPGMGLVFSNMVNASAVDAEQAREALTAYRAAQQAAALDELIASGEEIDNAMAQPAHPESVADQGLASENGGCRPTPSLTVGERAAFEAHYGPRWGTAYLEWRDELGRYAWDATQEAWFVWQARAALAPSAQDAFRAQVAHLVDDLTEEVAGEEEATYYRLRDGKDVLFSNMVGACARLLAAQPAAQAEPVALPHPGSPEASAMIDSVLAEYQWPTNAKNAARAGYVAAMRLAKPLGPSGWKLVLAEPDAAMQAAGFESPAWDALIDAVLLEKKWPYSCRQSAECVTGIFKAMLAASPPVAPSNPPAQGTGDIRELAERAGMRMNLWSMGAASLAYSDGCEGVTREHLEKFAGLLLAAQPLALTDKQIEKAWRLGFRHACDAERLNSDEEWGYKGANVIETVQALAQAQKEQA